ncbi:DUF418 domain-containing protein [Nonomuraea wenchangensis]
MTRIRELDALRGFAVCGIMLVNTWQHTRVPNAPYTSVDLVVEQLFQSRFYPIFSTLFGISFLLFLRGHSRWALLSRLFWLYCIGLAQGLFYAGEVLTDYALWGAVALLPASFIPGGWAQLALGVAGLAWGLLAKGGGSWLIPGLLLVGMGLWRVAPPRSLLLPGFAVSALVSAVLGYVAFTTGGWNAYSVGALAGALAYSLGLLLVLRPGLSAVLEPLGRMALTNYVTGTALIVLTLPLVRADPTRWAVVGLAAVTIAAQALGSRWWLARYRYGPLEWVWRCLTLFRRVPNRLESGRDHNRPLPDSGLH